MIQNAIRANQMNETDASPSARGGSPTGLVLSLLASQLLLLALAIAWGIYMVLIAKHGGIYSTEPSATVLYLEIIAVVAIGLFAVGVSAFLLKWYLRQTQHEVSQA